MEKNTPTLIMKVELGVSRAFFYCLSKSMVNIPSLQVPYGEKCLFPEYFYTSIGAPGKKQGLLILSESLVKEPPFVFLGREMLHFQNQWFIHSFISLRVPSYVLLPRNRGKTYGHCPWSPTCTESLHTMGCGLVAEGDRL
jgi:hypothetical protein